MKNMLYAIILTMVVCSTAWAAPFLQCDPQTGVDGYNIYKDGVLYASDVTPQPDGSLLFDLQGAIPEQSSWTATAYNVWGESAQSNPCISPPPVGVPTNLRLVLTP